MKIIIRNEADKQAFLNLVDDRKIIEGKKYVGEFKEIKPKRTLDQNALLHLWFHVVEVETGQPFSDVKDFVKQRFMPSVTKEIFGFDVQIWHTSKLKIPEFSQLLDLFKAWALDFHGIPLLTLGDIHFMEFYETYKGN